MPSPLFFTLEQGCTQHTKVQPLTDREFRVWVTAIDYSATNLLDGHISRRAGGVIAALSGARSIAPYARSLVASGLWETHPSGDGWQIHDYHVHQPTREYMKRLSEAGRAGANARWAKAKGTADRNANRITNRKAKGTTNRDAQELEPRGDNPKGPLEPWQPALGPRDPVATVRAQIRNGVIADDVDLEAELAAHRTLTDTQRDTLRAELRAHLEAPV